MGYDMRMKQLPTEAETAAIEANRERIKTAVAQRDTHERGTPEFKALDDEINRLYGEQFSLPSDYFRLNNWGMSYAGEYMAEREMVYPSTCPEFPAMVYPKREDFEAEEAYEAARLEAEEKNEELSRPILELHPEGGDVIPDHKLSSNDGWHVTEAECAAAVAAARASELPAPSYTDDADGIEKPISWWPEWVDFLDRASTRGGFAVY